MKEMDRLCGKEAVSTQATLDMPRLPESLKQAAQLLKTGFYLSLEEHYQPMKRLR
ncbi:hypothetical protein [Bacteroides acidifaciens]|uniref:hypothetical protein n=1 Tax=Bacteroides acidifaciens TaxID=85831 RepID=UPI003F692D69